MIQRAIDYDPSIVHSVASLASRWDVEPSVVYRLIKAGKLSAFKVGKEFRVTDKALREFEEGVSA